MENISKTIYRNLFKIKYLLEAIVVPFFCHLLLPKRYSVKCNICGWQGRNFHNIDCGYGQIYKDSTCPVCGSQPRHRSLFLYLKRVIPKNKRLKVLHFAPEGFFTGIFKSYRLIDYLSVDLAAGRAMQQEDITKLSFKDSSYDIIFCIHVLEHVKDDKRAMTELFRVLKKGGFAIIDVPIDYSRKETYEDDSIKSPEERTKAFWQWDHLRLYGEDFPNKLAQAGFKVKIDYFIPSLKPNKLSYLGLKNKPIYFCEKD